MNRHHHLSIYLSINRCHICLLVISFAPSLIQDGFQLVQIFESMGIEDVPTPYLIHPAKVSNRYGEEEGGGGSEMERGRHLDG